MTPSDRQPEILSLNQIKLEKLEWLWPNRIPLGKLSLIVGNPGIGKSLLSLYIAAQISNGRPWADSINHRMPADVLILTAEDDIADTVGPRLKAAGAYMQNIHCINSIISGSKKTPLYDLTANYDILVKTVQQLHPKLKLIIIDPITAYMAGKSENKNAEVREYLTPLANLAKSAKLSIIGISHLNKNQMTQTAAYRVLGSIGFTAAVRSIWLVHSDPENETNRLMVPSKGNLSNKPTGLSYTLTSTYVQTEIGALSSAYCSFSPDPVYTTAEELLAPKPPKKYTKKDDAADWLIAFLSDGPKLATDVLNIGTEMGYSERTLKRAKSKLSIQSIKSFNPETGTDFWEWSLSSS